MDTKESAFYIDPSQVNLGHAQIYSRSAVGGTPPYGYITSDPNVVVVVDAAKGDIRAMENGTATITAYDGLSHQGSYTVNVVPVVIEETFEGYPEWATTEDGGSVTFRTLTATKVSGYRLRYHSVGHIFEIGAGSREPFTVASLRLHTPCRRVEFTLKGVAVLPTFIVFFDSSGFPLETLHAAAIDTSHKWPIDFSAEDISRIEIHGLAVTFVTDMRFYL